MSSGSEEELPANVDAKRYHHNNLERKRRGKVRDKYDELGATLPKRATKERKMSRVQIVIEAEKYIRKMTTTCDEISQAILLLRQENNGNEQAVKKLETRLEQQRRKEDQQFVRNRQGRKG